MRSLISTALLLLPHSDATWQEETSLMQGLVARRQLTPDAKEARKDATARLMETATKMMKNGATPDVVQFIETTITEVNSNVLSAIVEEHHRDQQLIYDLLARFDAAVAAMVACRDSILAQQVQRDEMSQEHKFCRAEESMRCARMRRCEEELEEKWRRVVIEEEEMRRIHWAIHGEWCVDPVDPYFSLADPFQWHNSLHYEGDETSESVNSYPAVDLSADIIGFRTFTVEYFGLYIEQLPRVIAAWEDYELKLTECAAKDETWQLKVEECDGLQTDMRDQSCLAHSTNRQCASDYGHEYEMTMDAYLEACETIRQLEYDRKREWETLHIVTCLLETVYTHVIHAIESGEPCPTETENPEQTETEINYCHVVEEEFTRNLTIDYGEPPPHPDLPPPVAPPCTAQYIWEEHGAFPFQLQSSHSLNLESEDLLDYHAVINSFGWAGCAAPKTCIPCDQEELIIDPEYVDTSLCKAHHSHLRNGEMDWDTFKCLDGQKCIRSAGRCNGVAQCDDGSDEEGCDTPWGIPAIMQAETCRTGDDFTTDTQFRCADLTCTHIAGRCNGVNNCADGSDEIGCTTTTQGVTIEATSGFTATIETPQVLEEVFYDRTYTFDSLGSFTGHSFIKMHNDDKHIRNTHVGYKIRLPQPMTIYVAKLDSTELPWLATNGWARSSLEGVSYSGVRPTGPLPGLSYPRGPFPQTRHTDWSEEVSVDSYGPGEVWEKTFPAGVVEMGGNHGGDGSYLMFVVHPNNRPTPPVAGLWDQHFPNGDTGKVKCNNNVNMEYVADQMACQELAIQNGHPFYSFRHNGESAGHKCMSSATCDDHLDDRTNDWYIYANIPVYNYGQAGGGNLCPAGTDVSEANCLAAGQSMLASGQTQGRTHLVAGSWGWVPPGCSVQTHFTHGVDGDFAVHYNRLNGANDGGYTKVCDMQCQHLTNMDVTAGTFSHYGLDYSNSPSDDDCSATCTADPQCTAWVRQPSTGNCWISNQAVVTFEADSDRTTGLRCN